MTTSLLNNAVAGPPRSSVSPAVSVSGLTMTYGTKEILRGLDLEVNRGEIFAFLGPNGAGKTTTLEILEGFRRRTGGKVEVLGLDPERAGPDWKAKVGVVLQAGAPEQELTVRETLSLYAGFYPAPRPVDEVIEVVGLADQAGTRNRRLSGGQQRRLDMALALIGDPELIFLDEPTTGFDPLARRKAWEAIDALRSLGKTVFLTTHYLEEAEYLADRIAVLVGGRVVATGSPADLGDRRRRPTVIRYRDSDGSRVELDSHDPTSDLARLTAAAVEEGRILGELEVTRPSLEQIYLELTDKENAR